MLMTVIEMVTTKGTFFFFLFIFPDALKGGQTWKREGSLFSELLGRGRGAQIEPG